MMNFERFDRTRHELLLEVMMVRIYYHCYCYDDNVKMMMVKENMLLKKVGFFDVVMKTWGFSFWMKFSPDFVFLDEHTETCKIYCWEVSFYVWNTRGITWSNLIYFPLFSSSDCCFWWKSTEQKKKRKNLLLKHFRFRLIIFFYCLFFVASSSDYDGKKS